MSSSITTPSPASSSPTTIPGSIKPVSLVTIHDDADLRADDSERAQLRRLSAQAATVAHRRAHAHPQPPRARRDEAPPAVARPRITAARRDPRPRRSAIKTIQHHGLRGPNERGCTTTATSIRLELPAATDVNVEPHTALERFGHDRRSQCCFVSGSTARAYVHGLVGVKCGCAQPVRWIRCLMDDDSFDCAELWDWERERVRRWGCRASQRGEGWWVVCAGSAVVRGTVVGLLYGFGFTGAIVCCCGINLSSLYTFVFRHGSTRPPTSRSEFYLFSTSPVRTPILQVRRTIL